ncbi:unnamed protein product [Phytomonas sp. EM1]|nr:unnamed protein product [Phytomonas sp. EM1]|eukprot:CCW62942.1 unnamed protein product [Phytomonas sp. isolate EM1]
MANSSNVFWYAIQKHEYLAMLGILLGQRWFLAPILFVTRLTGYAVMTMCIGLIGLATITMACDVAPLIAEPGTWRYRSFIWIIVVGSFQIFFNFISAAVFSMRLGKTPPTQHFCPNTKENLLPNVHDVFTSRGFSIASTSRDDVRSSSKTHLCRQGDEEEDDSSDTSSDESTNSRPLKRPSCCSHLHKYFQQLCPRGLAPSLISTEVLRELERLSLTAEKYTPEERRYKLLDAPRRHCKTCCRLKAPREHHCSICNECVAKMDHHCMFLNNCVDVENQRYFVLFVLWFHVMSLFVVGFAGYASLRQMMYEHQLKKITQQFAQNLEMDGHTALQKDVVHLLNNAPYGPGGSKLLSTPVILTITLACVAVIFTGFFNVQNFLQIRRNVTPIESITIHHKRRWIFSSTNFSYRSPYDLGPWRNFIEVFRTVDDPVVRWELEKTGRIGTIGATSRVAGIPVPPQGCLRCFLHILHKAAVGIWLMAIPSLRPTGQDGIHYPIYSSEMQDYNGRV